MRQDLAEKGLLEGQVRIPSGCAIAAIVATDIENAPNYYFGTSSGPATTDRVFVLSEQEIFATEAAKSFGFYPGDELNDQARRFTATMYAKCRGAWWSSKNDHLGNSFWSTRTNGYTMANTTFVGEASENSLRGYLYVSDHLLKGYEPKQGDDLEGRLWMTGYVTDPWKLIEEEKADGE